MLTDNEIQAVIAQEVIDARGYDSDELAGNRVQSLNYYFGMPRGDEVADKSDMQSLDVADHVNATMSQLAPMMKSSLVEFIPSGEGDEEAAESESKVVAQLIQDSNAFVQYSDASFDALLQKNGWIHCYVDEVKQTWEDEHKDLDNMEITEALTPLDAKDMIEVTRQSENADGTMNLTVKHTMTSRELKIESVAPEYMLYAAGHKKIDVSDIRFIGERKMRTKSELLEMGIAKTVVDELPTISYENWVQANSREMSTDEKLGGQEPSTYVVEGYDCYCMIDVDGDGIAELWRVQVAGYDANIFLSKERAKFIPYCTGTARPMPHRTSGTSLYDALRFVQDAKTLTLRQLLDNQWIGNNVRVGAVEGEVNMDDLANNSNIIRMRSEGALVPVAFNDVGPSCINTLGYLDEVATSRAGAAADMQSGEFQIAGSSAAAAVGEIGHKEKMSAFYARNLIETIVRGSFLLIHQALRSYYSEPIEIQIAGKWVQSDPRRWKPRRSVRVIAGLSSSERREKAQALSQNIQYQSMALQAGFDGTLVTPEGIHATLNDWLRVADLDDISSYYVDPASDEAQQAGQAKQQAAEQEAAKQEKIAAAVTEAPLTLDKYKADQEDAFKRWDAILDAQVEEMKITGKGLADLEVQGLKGVLAAALQAADQEDEDND